jgi:hypothetical protein
MTQIEKCDDSLLLKKIIQDFNNYNNQTNELIRLQNELSKQESDLFAIQIRFVHK